jgi:hypothetical protein
VIEIDGPLWLAGALLICGAHVLYLRGWRREQRQYKAWWQNYDADAQKRHDDFMRAIDRDDDRGLGWNLSSSGERGQE